MDVRGSWMSVDFKIDNGCPWIMDVRGFRGFQIAENIIGIGCYVGILRRRIFHNLHKLPQNIGDLFSRFSCRIRYRSSSHISFHCMTDVLYASSFTLCRANDEQQITKIHILSVLRHHSHHLIFYRADCGRSA
jgi:hypothetical protein